MSTADLEPAPATTEAPPPREQPASPSKEIQEEEGSAPVEETTQEKGKVDPIQETTEEGVKEDEEVPRKDPFYQLEMDEQHLNARVTKRLGDSHHVCDTLVSVLASYLVLMYQRFIQVAYMQIVKEGETVMPPPLIEEVWQLHLQDTKDYVRVWKCVILLLLSISTHKIFATVLETYSIHRHSCTNTHGLQKQSVNR